MTTSTTNETTETIRNEAANFVRPFPFPLHPPTKKTPYMERNKVNHNGKCQSVVCMYYREHIRISGRERYESGLYGFCSECHTTFYAYMVKCPCCKVHLRTHSLFGDKRDTKVVRY
jgi:hypothetical protein